MKTKSDTWRVTGDKSAVAAREAPCRHLSPVTCHLGFTLIELLVVIAVMALIAAMISPVFGGIKRRQYLSTASAEMEPIKTALENYKTQYGVYPPCNPTNPVRNALYYELTGVTNIGGASGSYQTLDGASTVPISTYTATFGVGGVD